MYPVGSIATLGRFLDKDTCKEQPMKTIRTFALFNKCKFISNEYLYTICFSININANCIIKIYQHTQFLFVSCGKFTPKIVFFFYFFLISGTPSVDCNQKVFLDCSMIAHYVYVMKEVHQAGKVINLLNQFSTKHSQY